MSDLLVTPPNINDRRAARTTRAAGAWLYFSIPGAVSALASYAIGVLHGNWDFFTYSGTHGFHDHLERHAYLLIIETAVFGVCTLGVVRWMRASRNVTLVALLLNVGIPLLWGFYVSTNLRVLRAPNAHGERVFWAIAIAAAAMVGWLILTKAKGWRWAALAPAALIGWVDTSVAGKSAAMPADVIAALLLGAVGFVFALSFERKPAVQTASTDVAVANSDRTNTMAIIAFVSVWFISIVGIVLGHMALSEIRRTGERGRGLAIAALVLGYASVALLAVIGIALAVAASHR